jgi:EAL domain-containing protein (putative c-di-GMP-specific phosphodiesterase class I)
VVRAISHFCTSANGQVAADGVATRAERDALAALGVALFVGGAWETRH